MKSTLFKSTHEPKKALDPEILEEIAARPGVGALTPAERVRLEKLEREVEDNMLGFVRCGTALRVIQVTRLYRETHEIFDDYVLDRFEMAKSRAYQLINGATVYQNLHNCGLSMLPCNEAQARAMTKVPEEEQPLVWNLVVTEAPEGKITGKFVNTIVSEHLGLKVKKKAAKTKKEAKTDNALPKDVQDALAEMVDLAQAAKDKPYREAFAKHLKGIAEILK